MLREGVPFSLTSGEFHGLHARWADLYGQQVMEVCWDEGAFFDGVTLRAGLRGRAVAGARDPAGRCRASSSPTRPAA
ncbi:MAG: hypothetical protein V9H69_18305 [Anaerolineae bacterium]